MTRIGSIVTFLMILNLSACYSPREQARKAETIPQEQAEKKPDTYEVLASRYSAFRAADEPVFKQLQLFTINAQELVEKTKGKPWVSRMLLHDIYRKGDDFHARFGSTDIWFDTTFDLTCTKEQSDRIRTAASPDEIFYSTIAVFTVDSFTRPEFGIYCNDPESDGDGVPEFTGDTAYRPFLFRGKMVDCVLEDTE